MAAITNELLRHHGLDVTPREVEAFMVSAIERLGPAFERAEPLRDLSVAEIKVLESGGWAVRSEDAATGPDADPVFTGAATYWELLTSGLTTRAAAARCGVHESRIRQRLKERSLYGIKQGAAWRLPIFQFAGPRVVPGWERVLPALAEGLHPVSVYRWFTGPCVDLVGVDGQPLSPRDWLLAGGDVDAVVAQAADLSAA